MIVVTPPTQSFKLCWSERSPSEEFQRLRDQMSLPTNVFIEATDSSPKADHIEFALSFANVQTTFPGSKIVAGEQFPSELLENEEVFPHYFTVWLFDAKLEVVASPPFATDPAAGRYGRSPYCRESEAHLPDWSLVEAWMRENRVYAGLSYAFHALTIERIEQLWRWVVDNSVWPSQVWDVGFGYQEVATGLVLPGATDPPAAQPSALSSENQIWMEEIGTPVEQSFR